MSAPAGADFRLDGRVALITGAARGIGLTTAGVLAHAGARVALVDIDSELLDTALAGLRAAGVPAVGWSCDVGDEASVANTVQRAADELGPVDLLVNNAAISRHRPPEEASRADWHAVLEVNLTGAFLASTEVARQLISRGRPGAIVNLSSIAGSTSLGRGIFAYGVAKAGIEQLTRELAVEWAAYGIRVNAIAPCQVDTEGFANVAREKSSAGDGLVDRVLRGIPLGRLADPVDIANAVLFLAGDGAAMITGVVLPVDGGNLAMNAGATLRSPRHHPLTLPPS